jgi:hypothetical protein
MDRNWKEHERLQRHDFAALALLVLPTAEAILATQKLASKKHSERSSPPLRASRCPNLAARLRSGCFAPSLKTPIHSDKLHSALANLAKERTYAKPT